MGAMEDKLRVPPGFRRLTAEEQAADVAKGLAMQAEYGATHSITGGFGMARIKKEGAAVHPDDIDADMTPQQEARQLAAYERDTGDVSVTRVTYGTAKSYDSESEMIADIQGRPSPVFPLTPEQQARHDARQAKKSAG